MGELEVHVTERVRSVLGTGQDESGVGDGAILAIWVREALQWLLFVDPSGASIAHHCGCRGFNRPLC